MVVLFTTGNPAPALAGRDEALVDAVTGAFTAEQMSSLIASATGRGDPRTGQAAQSLEQLQLLLGVGRDVVRALLRILDRPDIRPDQSAQALAQSAIQYHAVTDQLAAIISEDAEGQRLATDAQAAMLAGRFSDTEVLLRQLEDHEVAFSDADAPADRTPDRIAERTSSTVQHLIRAAQARTLLGEIALMKLRYGDATDDFQLAQQRLASLPSAEPNSAEAQPGKSSPAAELALQGSEGVTIDLPAAVPSRLPAADAAPAKSADPLVVADTPPPLARRDVKPPDRLPPVQPATTIHPDQPVASQKQDPPAIGSATIALNLSSAAATAAPPEATKQATAPPVVAATAKIPSASPVLSADILTLLLNRGDALLALGDVSSARLLYQRAAAGGDGRAATGMGKTYDPLFLSAIGARGIQADSGAAATWYRRAIGLGDEAAAERLKRLSQVSVR